jgi:diguanylate cyclase (GGDEF)-like protein
VASDSRDPAGAGVGKRSGNGTSATDAGNSGRIGGEDTKAPQRSRTNPPDVITRVVIKIVEVIPLWVKALVGLLTGMLVGLGIASHRRLRRRAAEFEHGSLHDPLTGLANRMLFQTRITEALEACAVDGGRIGVLLIDLDGFKEVNDTLGHGSGDELLQLVAERLDRAVPGGGTVARLGGDEFGVLLTGLPNDAMALATAASLRRSLQRPYAVADLTVHSDASIGIAIGPSHGDDPDTLLRHADIAMYLAKDQRTGGALYDEHKDRYSTERLGMIGELRAGVANREFTLHFQPQLDPTSGRVDGVEALVRWRHPTRGLIAPDEFVAIAERTGVIRPLTMWVIEAAIRECAAWLGAGFELRVAVNLSAASLVDVELPTAIEALLDRWGVPPRYLRIEITETTAMSDPLRTRSVLNALDELGVDLSVDDFGTGYSSLAYLRSLPVRELKIDRSFIAKMTQNANDHAIVIATIDLAHTLGLRVVAEGVEDHATLRELRRRGCDLVQGYLFTRPLPVAELRRWLANWPATGGSVPRRGGSRATTVRERAALPGGDAAVDAAGVPDVVPVPVETGAGLPDWD